MLTVKLTVILTIMLTTIMLTIMFKVMQTVMLYSKVDSDVDSDVIISSDVAQRAEALLNKTIQARQMPQKEIFIISFLFPKKDSTFFKL